MELDMQYSTSPSTTLTKKIAATSPFTTNVEQQQSQIRRNSDHTSIRRARQRKLSTYELWFGTASLPHPNKRPQGGEDSYFISPCNRAFGVADGVGGWADHGIDAGQYSRELMNTACEHFLQNKSFDPNQVLTHAYENTHSVGTSTACILTVERNMLRVSNLGDSGFIVLRHKSKIKHQDIQCNKPQDDVAENDENVNTSNVNNQPGNEEPEKNGDENNNNNNSAVTPAKKGKNKENDVDMCQDEQDSYGLATHPEYDWKVVARSKRTTTLFQLSKTTWNK